MVQAFIDYIFMSPPPSQGTLLQILTYAEQFFPDAEQRIYHRLPTFFCGKSDVLNVGAHKDHISLYINSVINEVQQAYPDCIYTKGTVQFPYSEPFPFDVFEDICRIIQAHYQE